MSTEIANSQTFDIISTISSIQKTNTFQIMRNDISCHAVNPLARYVRCTHFPAQESPPPFQKVYAFLSNRPATGCCFSIRHPELPLAIYPNRRTACLNWLSIQRLLYTLLHTTHAYNRVISIHSPPRNDGDDDDGFARRGEKRLFPFRSVGSRTMSTTSCHNEVAHAHALAAKTVYYS